MHGGLWGNPRELLDAVGSVLDDAFCLCEILLDDAGRPVDYRFLEVNHQFEAMTGLADARGRTAHELVPDLEPHWAQTYGIVALERRPQRFQNGSVPMGRVFDVYAAPADPPGRFTIVFRDITALKKAEDERERALATTRQLLEELNHRVMNSLGMISSIIAMEARARTDGEGRQALKRIETRLQAAAQLYAALDTSGAVGTVNAADYLPRIVDGLARSLGADGKIRMTHDITPAVLPTARAAPLGLIVNELVTNGLKYAFPEGKGGTISINLSRDGDTLVLTVSDNGQGIGPVAASGSGLGQQLVEAFVHQIGGSREIETGSGGTTVTVRFPAE